MEKKVSKFKRLQENAQALLNDQTLKPHAELPGWHKCIHFWALVIKSFIRNRCPVRASALAYATVLALIPMLAVAVSITSSFLKKEGEDEIDHFIAKMVASITPPAEIGGTNLIVGPHNLNATNHVTGGGVGRHKSSARGFGPRGHESGGDGRTFRAFRYGGENQRRVGCLVR